MTSKAAASPRFAAPLEGYRLSASRSSAAIREAVNTLTEDEHSLSPRGAGGRIDGRVNGVSLGCVNMVYVSYGAEVTVVSPPARERVLIVLPLGPMGVETQGTRMVASEPFLLGTVATTTMHPDPLRGAVVGAVDAAALETYAAATGLARPVLAAGAGALRLAHPRLVAGTWLQACRDIDAAVDPLSADRGSALSTVLMSALILGMLPVAPERPCPAPPEPGYVRAARVLMGADLATPLRVEDLAATVGISARQLQAAFSEHHGRGPAAYLRELRLSRARALLERPVPGGAPVTVSAVASAVGIGHLGRFSSYYAARFGEAPSVTLARAVAPGGALDGPSARSLAGSPPRSSTG